MEQDKGAGENAGVIEIHVLEDARVGVHCDAHSIGFDAESGRLNGDHEGVQGGGDVDPILDEHVNACMENNF